MTAQWSSLHLIYGYRKIMSGLFSFHNCLMSKLAFHLGCVLGSASLRPISSEKHNGNHGSLLMLNIHKQFCLIPTDPIVFDPCKFLANFCHMLIFKIKSSITTSLYIQLSNKKSSFSCKISKECISSLCKSASLKNKSLH